MTSSGSIIPLGWTAFCMLAFHSSTSHGLNKEENMRKKFTMAHLNTHLFFWVGTVQSLIIAHAFSWPLSPLTNIHVRIQLI